MGEGWAEADGCADLLEVGGFGDREVEGGEEDGVGLDIELFAGEEGVENVAEAREVGGGRAAGVAALAGGVEKPVAV